MAMVKDHAAFQGDLTAVQVSEQWYILSILSQALAHSPLVSFPCVLRCGSFPQHCQIITNVTDSHSEDSFIKAKIVTQGDDTDGITHLQCVKSLANLLHLLEGCMNV